MKVSKLRYEVVIRFAMDQVYIVPPLYEIMNNLFQRFISSETFFALPLEAELRSIFLAAADYENSLKLFCFIKCFF
jgi:hypothetical protein